MNLIQYAIALLAVSIIVQLIGDYFSFSQFSINGGVMTTQFLMAINALIVVNSKP